MDSGLFGFPSEVADDPILDYLLHEGGGYENAEERRLFYVALTRTRHRVYFLYNVHASSKFLFEFIKDNAFVEQEHVKSRRILTAFIDPQHFHRRGIRQGTDVRANRAAILP